MNILLITDMEGISGIRNFSSKENCIQLYNEEIQACMEILKACQIHTFTVCDAHDRGTLIEPALVNSFGGNKVEQVYNIDFSRNYDAAMLIGYHGMSDSLSFSSHTYRNEVKSIVSNKQPIGEVEVLSRFLGANHVPVILVAGDSQATYEANFFNAYRQICTVKSPYDVQSLPREEYYKKLAFNIKASLQLDFSQCYAIDNQPIKISYHHEDIIKHMTEFQNDGIYQQFNNCSSFVQQQELWASSLNRALSTIENDNYEFILEMRAYAENIPIDQIKDSNVLDMLQHTKMHQLSASIKDDIRNYVKSLV